MNQSLFHFRDTIKLDHKTTSTRIQNMWQEMIYDFTTRYSTRQHNTRMLRDLWLHHAQCSQFSTLKPKPTQHKNNNENNLWYIFTMVTQHNNMKQKQLVVTKTEEEHETETAFHYQNRTTTWNIQQTITRPWT